MPSLLQNAYGEAWGSGGTMGRMLGSSLGTTVPEVNESIPKQEQQTPFVETQTSSSVPISLVRRERGYDSHRGGDYVFNLSIKIDQQDCHLLCLFLGV